jgi:RecA/RadA recombinase
LIFERLDEELNGGLFDCEVTELAGSSGSGKTQVLFFFHLLIFIKEMNFKFCLSCVLENASNLKAAIYIDTENNFSATQMYNISQAKGNVEDTVFIVKKIFNFFKELLL